MDKAQVQPNRTEVIDGVRAQVADELGLPIDEVTPETVLKQLPGADSVKMLRVVAKVERRYEVEFEDDDIFAVRTAAELADLVLAALSGGQ